MEYMESKVFVTRRLPGPALEMMGRECKLEVWPEDEPPSHQMMCEKVAGVDGLLCLLTDTVDKEVLDAAGGGLKVVSNYAVGYDNIDIAETSSRKIPVGNTPGVLTETTADMAFALLMAGARRIVEGARFADEGRWMSWSPTLLLGEDIFGSTLGILGMGRIGRAVARRAKGFNMNVIFSHPSSPVGTSIDAARAVSLDELFERSDFLSVHVPLNNETHHMINGEVFKKMKKTAILINTARGPIVDHGALWEALESGHIAFAALDVTEPEPLPRTHPLYTLQNCLIVPHLGSASIVTRAKMGVMAAENLLAGVMGRKLPNCVNPEVYQT